MTAVNVMQVTPISIRGNRTELTNQNGGFESPRDGNSHPSITRAVTRMLLREKTFVSQLVKAKINEPAVVNNVHDSDVEDEHDAAPDVVIDEQQDDDIEFDFDDDEEEKEDEIRKRTRRKPDTTTIYNRACEKYRLHPNHSYASQIHTTTVCLRSHQMNARQVKPIAISLVRDKLIYVLDISYNNIGPVGIMYIAEMLQENNSIIDLNLSGTNPGRAGLEALSEILPLNKSLRILHLSDNRIEHTEAHILADIIKTATQLRELYISHNRLGFYGGRAIAHALSTNTSLRTLDLQWNHLRRDSAVEIGKALALNKGLKLLNLAWNGFGKEGCIAMAHALAKNLTLLELDMTCNRVDFTSLGFLLKGLAKNRGLHTINLGCNPMTTEGAKALVQALGNSKVSQIVDIDLQDVPVDGAFVRLVKAYQYGRIFKVKHGHEMKIGTTVESKEHDATNLSRYDPVLVLFEYMRLDNLRLIDMFKSFDSSHKDRLGKNDFREGLSTLKIPITEHALEMIMEKLDLNKDGVVDLEEMIKGHREMSRQINQRQLKAKAKRREDEGLVSLRKMLKDIIQKRKEDQEMNAGSTRRENRALQKEDQNASIRRQSRMRTTGVGQGDISRLKKEKNVKITQPKYVTSRQKTLGIKAIDSVKAK